MGYLFWTKIAEWARQKQHEAFLNEQKHTRKCYNCKSWDSETGGVAAVRDDPNDRWFEFTTCKKCGYETRWDCRGMMPTVAVEQQP